LQAFWAAFVQGSTTLNICKVRDAFARKLRFQDMDFASIFDGVWARASLLHLEPADLKEALRKLVSALKSNGWLYACFKEGEGERFDADGRFFCDMSESRFRSMLLKTDGSLRECLAAEDQFGRPERWIHFLVSRADNR
jgi:hypothetical protein